MKFLNNVLEHKDYKAPTAVGDHMMIEKVNLYLEKRKKILANSKIDKKLFKFYEDKLIKDNRDIWWHHYSKSYLNNVLWFLKRLNKDLNLEDEFKLLKQFYQRLPMTTRLYGMYGMDNLQCDKEIYEKFKAFK